MSEEESPSKRITYDPRFLKLLIEKSIRQAGYKENNPTNRLGLATKINSKFGYEDANQRGYLSEKYLAKMYNQCDVDIDKATATKYFDSKIETLLKFVNCDSYEKFKEDNTPEVVIEVAAKEIQPPTNWTSQKRIGKQFDLYDLRARLLPLSMGLLPLIFLLVSLLFNRTIIDSLDSQHIWTIVLLGLVGIIYFLIASSDLVAGLSKVYQNKYFMKVNGFPSTYLMLFADNTYSEDYKNKYRKKILHLSGINLLGRYEERADKNKAIQALNAAGDYVRQYVYEGLVKTQNIRYGFIRNLIGATFLGVPFSLMVLVIGLLTNSISLTILSICSLFIYSIILFFKKHLLLEAAEGYAKELLAEFLKEN